MFEKWLKASREDFRSSIDNIFARLKQINPEDIKRPKITILSFTFQNASQDRSAINSNNLKFFGLGEPLARHGNAASRVALGLPSPFHAATVIIATIAESIST